VGFSHAFVHLYSEQHEYRTIAVLEEDFFVERTFDQAQVRNLGRLLENNQWTFIRMGRRPYFLEGLTYPESCPLQCKCEQVKDFGSGLCRMHNSGCDMRSSDFYISSKRVFKKFAEILHDAVKYPWQEFHERVSPHKRERSPVIDMDVLQSFKNQWSVIPQLSFQHNLRDLDGLFQKKLTNVATIRHQERLENQFNKLCVSTFTAVLGKETVDELHGA
jgi:hypothetical protein